MPGIGATVGTANSVAGSIECTAASGAPGSELRPHAAFSADVVSGTDPLTVTFTDASTNTPTSWSWQKNDGSGWVPFEGTPTAQSPEEDFTEGTWSVRLVATNASGSDSELKASYLTVDPAPAYTGPLDLVPGALVAFSLRALSSAWRGQNVARLRRSSDDAVLDFAADAVTGDFPSAAAIAWRDAVGAADAFVVTRYDQSGNGKDETQATVGLQPLWTPNAVGGKPVIDYVELKRLSTTADINYTGAMTTLFVGKFGNAGVGGEAVLGGGDLGSGDHGFMLTNDTAGESGSGTAGFFGSFIFSDEFSSITSCATSADPAATIGEYFVAGTTVSDSADGTVRLNGVLQAVVNERTGSITVFSDRFTSGDADPAAYDEFIGKEGESILYASIISAENILAINQNQGTYFGITLS